MRALLVAFVSRCSLARWQEGTEKETACSESGRWCNGTIPKSLSSTSRRSDAGTSVQALSGGRCSGVVYWRDTVAARLRLLLLGLRRVLDELREVRLQLGAPGSSAREHRQALRLWHIVRLPNPFP